MPATQGAVARTPGHVLAVGISARAVAESAALAGYAVTALDAFGDLDQHPLVRALALPRDFGLRFTARAVARVAHELSCDAVVYQSPFENHPAAVRALASRFALWGNDPAVLRRVRDPLRLARAVKRRGFAVPALRSRRLAPGVSGSDTTPTAAAPPPSPDETASESRDHAAGDGGAESGWLVKARASGGGHSVNAWRSGSHVPRGHYLQEFVGGTPGSVVFAADGARAVPLGVSRQLVGDGAFGATGWRYCGSILARAGDAQFAGGSRLVRTACELGCALAEEFGLVGVNGVDFVARGAVPYTIEVNPRYSASMELVERQYGASMFGVHVDACARGALPATDFAAADGRWGAVGKAIVFAKGDVRVGDTTRWIGDASVRDVPHPLEEIPAGRPVCTVFATGSDAARCYAALVRRADAVYGELTGWGRAVA